MGYMKQLPPGQRLSPRLLVLHFGTIPPFEPPSWSFFVEGLVRQPLRWSWDQFLNLPRTVQRSDFHCVTGWSYLDGEWEGVPARTLVELAQPQPEAKYALIIASGVYTTNLTLPELCQEDALLALKLNGQALAPEYGGPVRLLVPRKYAYKSAKWVRGFRLLKEEELGYWESRGYSNSADPWREERYS